MFQLGKEKAAEHPAGLLSGKRKAPRERWWCRRGKGHAAAFGSAVSEPKPPNAALQGGCQMKFLQNEKPPSEPGGSGGEGAASILRGARQRSTQALDATLSRLVNAASPLLDRKGYKVVLVREPLVPRLAQQLRHLTMLLGRFRHGVPRCELRSGRAGA